MGELFKREFPKGNLDFTGERFTSAVTGQTAIEHLHRTVIARNFCKGKAVLDIASGEGYCSAILAQVAQSVTGVDISSEAVDYANREYARENLVYKCGSALDIPVDDHSVDVVVSFETIEHFTGHQRFLDEIKRVLKPGGLLIVSTPDQAVYSPESEPANPYHVHEMSRTEFVDLVSGSFAHLALLGQRTLIGSIVALDEVNLADAGRTFYTYDQRPGNAFERSKGLARAKYLIALASDDPIKLLDIEESVFVSTSEIDRALNACVDVRKELADAKTALAESLGSEARWRVDIETIAGRLEASKVESANLTNNLKRVEGELSHQLQNVVPALEAAVADQRQDAGKLSLYLRELEEQVQYLKNSLELTSQQRDAIISEKIELEKIVTEIEFFQNSIEQLEENYRINSENIRQEHQKKEDDYKRQLTELECCLHVERERLSKLAVDYDKLKVEFHALKRREADIALFDCMAAGAPGDARLVEMTARLLNVPQNSGSALTLESNCRIGVIVKPDASERWEEYARALHRNARYQAALGAWNRAVFLAPASASALSGLSGTLKALGNLEEAKIMAMKAFALNPASPAIEKQLDDEDIDLVGKADIVLNSDQPSSHFNMKEAPKGIRPFVITQLAKKAERNGRNKIAAKYYSELALLYSKDVEALIRHGDAVARNRGLRAASTFYLQACAIAPELPLARRRALDVKHENFGFKPYIKAGIVRDDDGVFTSVSDDPQLIFDPDHRILPSGPTLFSFSIQVLSQEIRPVVYVWHGENGEEVSAFTLPVMRGDVNLDILIPLPDHITGIRFDPDASVGAKFLIGRMGWLSGPSLEGRFFKLAPPSYCFMGDGNPSQQEVAPPQSERILTATPKNDLQSVRDSFWISTDIDPQFDLGHKSELPSGWVWLDLEMSAVNRQIDPILYIWTEGEIVEIPVPLSICDGGSAVLVHLPNNISQMRLDPTFHSGIEFRLGKLSWREFQRSSAVFLPLTSEIDEANIVDSKPQLGLLPFSIDLQLKPSTGLNRINETIFETVNDDPQCILEIVELHKIEGLLKITIETGSSDKVLNSSLYAWSGAADKPVEYYFDHLEANRQYEYLIILPKNTTSLRFDPADMAGITMALPKITLTNDIDESDSYQVARNGVADNSILEQHAELVPLQHLEKISDGYWTTGSDPQFSVSLDKGMPSGWTLVSIDMSVQGVVARPYLYIWQGENIHTIPLAPIDGTMVVEQLIRMPDQITAIRFDPTDAENVRFSVNRLSFVPVVDVAGADVYRIRGGDRGVDYALWSERFDTLTATDRSLIVSSVARLSYRPLISIVMPVYNPEPRFLRRCLDTILDQLYPHWELCVADDCSPNPAIRSILSEYAARDERIKVIYRSENGHISRASNSAIEHVTGEFVALMDHDDEIPAHALYMVAHELNRHPEADIIYTDEDKIDASGRRHDPHFKTDWNQELFYSQNMVAHLGVYRTSLVKAVNGFRAGFEGSQDYDFTLRLLKLTSPERIRHIPFVLYHWRIFEGVRTFSSNNPSRSIDTARRAMEEYFADVEPDSTVLPIEAFPSWWRIKRPLPQDLPSVTIVIPTRDRVSLVRNCVSGVLDGTDYSNLDVIIIDNGSTEDDSLAYFELIGRDPRVTVLRDDGPFNYSRLNNTAVAMAKGDYICFLNNDIEVIEAGWLSEMMSQAVRDKVGAVGTRLLYGNGTLQHAGVTLGIYGVAAHGHRHFPGNSIGYFGHPQLVRETSAVTAAALVMRKDLFTAIGGFDSANLAVSYNDVDLCLRVREAGYKVVYTPFAPLRHLESVSRGPDVTPEQKELQRIERGYMQARWGALLNKDPHYSLNLSLDNEDYRLAFPSRAVKPWRQEADVVEQIVRDAQSKLAAASDIDLFDVRELAILAAQTSVIIAAAQPFAVLDTLSDDFEQSGLSPACIAVVDNTGAKERFVKEGSLARFKIRHPDIPVILITDTEQDFNASRTVNLALSAITATPYFLIMTENCSLSSSFLSAVLASYRAASNPQAVIVPRVFVRENEARDGVFTDGYIDMPLSQIAPSLDTMSPVRSDMEGLQLADRLAPNDVVKRPAIETTDLMAGGILFAQRSLLIPQAQEQPNTEGDNSSSALYDVLFLTQPARLEDVGRKLKVRGADIYATTAALSVFAAPRPLDIVHVWQYWHDYLWLNQKAHGVPDTGRIEFVCPFHRGDVLIGLQVAFTAYKAGKNLRFHVAESLLSWVQDFHPPFPVEGLPVPVPSAQETSLYLLRSYEHLLKRGDSSPMIARSHPFRGLDAMDNNLVKAMLGSVGLAPDTPIESLLPVPSVEQQQDIDKLLAPFGNKVILLHRSGGWGLKTIPDTILQELAEVVKDKGFKLVQIGGPGDAKCAQADGIIAQNLSAGHWAALFKKVAAVFGVDSWSAHMAAILDVPQVTFYGSTQPRHVASKPFFKKNNAPALMVSPTVACSPCNSLTCLIAPDPFCRGYNISKSKIGSFLEEIGGE
ncbi:glycosyltransferase [Agrobacterium vitis]|nr:glycosyltransferase [Agrobacterium vitis]UJL71515.1 glycosyltransferase [Agrobacterium vitis]